MRLQQIIISFLLLIIPMSAFAEQQWLFSLRKGENVTWKGYGNLQGEERADGTLLLAHGTGGFLTSDFQFHELPDSVDIVTTTKKSQDVLFVWTRKDGQSLAHDITLPEGLNKTTSIDLSSFDDWKDDVDSFGFQFTPGSQVLLTSVTFGKSTWYESMWYAFSSFWNLDEYRSYSINFVWGPELAFHRIAAEKLWTELPPEALSATRVLLATLVIILVIMALALSLRTSLSFERRRSLLMRWSFLLLACAWIGMDIRMSSEYLSWMLTDAQTYLFSSSDTRTFRERDRFYDFAEFAKPYVADRESYVFFAERPWPYLGNMRYITYPSVPGNDTHDDTWVIYKRPEIMVDSEGRLSAYGSPLSKPGIVLDKFERGSFIFRTQE